MVKDKKCKTFPRQFSVAEVLEGQKGTKQRKDTRSSRRTLTAADLEEAKQSKARQPTLARNCLTMVLMYSKNLRAVCSQDWGERVSSSLSVFYWALSAFWLLSFSWTDCCHGKTLTLGHRRNWASQLIFLLFWLGFFFSCFSGICGSLEGQ